MTKDEIMKIFKLKYYSGKDIPEKQINKRAVVPPKNLDELFIWIEKDQILDKKKDKFVDTGTVINAAKGIMTLKSI
jgi:hypothetical protein